MRVDLHGHVVFRAGAQHLLDDGEYLSSAVAPPEPGGRNSPERQLTASVLTGSTGTATLSVRPQGQSKLFDQQR